VRIGRIGAAVPILYAFFTLTVIVPLAIVVFAAFTDAPPFSGATALHATWANFAALWAPNVAQAAGNTIFIAVIGTFGALLIGSTLAWLAARSDVPARPFVHLVGITPLFLSVLVASIAWSELASGPTAYFSLMLETLPGIAFVYAIYEAPYPFLFMYAALTLVNPELEEAAAAHGASLAHVLRRITLPLLKPALLGSTLLVFALIVEDFPVPQILGVPVGITTLSTRIYLFMTSVPALPNVAAALSAVLMVVTSFFVFTQRRLLEGRDYRTLTGKGMQARELRLRRLRWPAFALVAGYALIAVGAPIFALLEGALRKNVFVQNAAALFDVHAFSFHPLFDALADPDVARGTVVSLTAGAFAAVVGAIAFLSIAFVVHRTKSPGPAAGISRDAARRRPGAGAWSGHFVDLGRHSVAGLRYRMDPRYRLSHALLSARLPRGRSEHATDPRRPRCRRSRLRRERADGRPPHHAAARAQRHRLGDFHHGHSLAARAHGVAVSLYDEHADALDRDL
jgi:iron(III) transport system permease protein